ncbi:MAG: scramblase [Actinobacteria bacterium]|nr:scramblase [Actinomycetota bacterium]
MTATRSSSTSTSPASPGSSTRSPPAPDPSVSDAVAGTRSREVASGRPRTEGGSPVSDLLDRDRLVFRQKAKLIEMNIDFAIRDPEGNEVGRMRQEGQSKLKKLARFVTSVDQFMTHTLAVYDGGGAKVLELTRPAKIFKSTVVVRDGAGTEVGRIVQQNMVGKIRFALQGAQGEELGSLNAENWRAWNFSIRDGSGTEVARITKTWEGLAKTLFTTADNYLLEVSGQGMPLPLRQLILASAVGVDLSLKQDARGLG